MICISNIVFIEHLFQHPNNRFIMRDHTSDLENSKFYVRASGLYKVNKLLQLKSVGYGFGLLEFSLKKIYQYFLLYWLIKPQCEIKPVTFAWDAWTLPPEI